MNDPYWMSAAAFVLALTLSLAITPFAHSVSHRLGLVVHPRLFGRDTLSVSYLGGVVVAGIFMMVLVLAAVVSDGVVQEAGVLVAGALALLLFGFADDRARERDLAPWVRVAVEAVIATGVWWGGVRGSPTGYFWLDAFLTIFFLVAATNAFNLLDNMDGVAGATGAAVAGALFVLASLAGQYLVAALAAGVLGATLGFLRHNLFGARVYLGNGGALFLGFLLAATTLKLRLPLSQPWSFVGAISVLGVPATDTSLVILSRSLARRPLFQGGVDHLSHRLVRLGLSTQAAAASHAVGSAIGGLAPVAAIIFGSDVPLVAAIIAFGAAGAVLLVSVDPYRESREDEQRWGRSRTLEATGRDGSVRPSEAEL